MNWKTEWSAIADSIAGHVDATTVFLRGLRVMNSDGYGVKRKQLLPAARAIYASLRDLSDAHSSGLPAKASAALRRFLVDNESLLTNAELDNIEAVMAGTTALAGFRAEFQFLVADVEASVMRTSERAFEHLQRLIVADRNCQALWTEAFRDGETACERLGSAHLLQHGIWAFKVSATGERTDLVFNEPLPVSDKVAALSDGLVLTEWKIVRKLADLGAQITQARTQAQLYAKGALGGIELQSYRFLVIVTEDRMPMPSDTVDGVVTYRAVNIAVSPKVPSQQ